MAEQCRVERYRCLFAVGLAGCGHLLQHERMAADRALPEDDQAARQDVRAFDGDRNGYLHVRGTDEVRRSHADALAADDVHRVVDDLPAALGEMELRDAGDDRGLLAQVDRRGGQRARGIHHVQVAAHPRQRFLDALELADRRLELLAHVRIAADGTHRELGHPGGRRWQRDAAPGRQALHQHPPAAAEHRLPADDPLHRNEHVLAERRTVLEHRIERHVPPADLDPGMRGRDQRARDAEVFAVADQAVGVVGAEGEPEERRDRALA